MNNKLISTQNVIFNKILKLQGNNNYTNINDLVEDIQAMLNDDKRVNKKYIIIKSDAGEFVYVATEKELIEIEYEDLKVILK